MNIQAAVSWDHGAVFLPVICLRCKMRQLVGIRKQLWRSFVQMTLPYLSTVNACRFSGCCSLAAWRQHIAGRCIDFTSYKFERAFAHRSPMDNDSEIQAKLLLFELQSVRIKRLQITFTDKQIYINIETDNRSIMPDSVHRCFLAQFLATHNARVRINRRTLGRNTTRAFVDKERTIMNS